jgi:excisionase family DNA binding protein
MIPKLSANMHEAVEMTGMSRAAIYRAIKAKKITPVKNGKRTLLPVSELERFISSLPKAEG